jgi:Spy/CpxP family protein refolding chaperone
LNVTGFTKEHREKAMQRMQQRTEHLQKVIAILTKEQRLELKKRLEAKAAGSDRVLAHL